MFAAFVVVFGLAGSPVPLAAEANPRFPTLEACQDWNNAAAKRLQGRLAEQGLTFDRLEAKCAEDVGQTPDAVFSLVPPADAPPAPPPQ